MSSVTNQSGGRRMLQFFDREGQRRTVRLGKMSKKSAETIGENVDEIVALQTAALPLDRDSATWIADLSPTLYAKFVAANLLEPRAEKQKHTLGDFLARHIASLTRKPATIDHLNLARRYLMESMGENRELSTISTGDADAFRRELERTMNAKSTVPRICGRAKQFFRAAKREGLIAENPFEDMKHLSVKENEARQFFVTSEIATKVLNACPTLRCQLIFALARYGGLRSPSEVVLLRWGDIDWEKGRFTVHSPKTAHHEGKATREVPLFPELRPYLEKAFNAYETANGRPPSRDEFVVYVRNREGTNNFGPQIDHIVEKVGLTPWPKTMQNLRSTRETELLDAGHPLKAVCNWLGNTPTVAMKHYAQVRPEHFEHAAKIGGAAKSAALMGGEASQQAATPQTPQTQTREFLGNCDRLLPDANHCGTLEPATSSPSRTRTYDPAVNSRLLYQLSYRGRDSLI
jgi:integrase